MGIRETVLTLTKYMDNQYIDYIQRLSGSEFSEVVEFEFVDGGNGAMSRAEIILHVVNHGTYHRGYVANMMYQASVKPPAIDFPVYLRELKSA